MVPAVIAAQPADEDRLDRPARSFVVLLQAGWRPGDPTGEGAPLRHAYLRMSTIAAQAGPTITGLQSSSAIAQSGFPPRALGIV